MDSVATIDIAALFGPAGPARAACDAALWDGLRRTGSVIITGYPDAERVDMRARSGLQVFDLPAAQRRRLTTRLEEPGNPNLYRGYWPVSPERRLKNDFFDVGPADPVPGPDLPGAAMLSEPTPWPDPEPEPGWADTVRAHYDHLNRVAQAMILSIGRSAGFAEAAIADRFEGAHSTLRFLSYAGGAANPVTGPDGVRVSAARHVDESGLSLLWQEAPGLEAEGPDGLWRSIPMVPNAISVHVGSVMTGLTRGAVPATPHRVRASDGPRRSVGFFLEPALGAPLTPADHKGPVTVRDSYAWQLLKTFSQRPHWQDVVKDPELGL
ncbi:2OG-Fe(II) oxygenase family protein [Nisaea sp.]|uniref:2OG-Fe(II) oxygenase family protein n=1 Tax=Nisaea sp. TaxID=2024842 RepID=UPI0032F0408C